MSYTKSILKQPGHTTSPYSSGRRMASILFATDDPASGYRPRKNRPVDWIPGLYAIVIPAGGGKSWCSLQFGQLDVDKILDDKFEDTVRAMRVLALKNNMTSDWKAHNDVWYSRCKQALGKVDWSSEPKVLFCHTEEFALCVRAAPIGIFCPSRQLLEENLRADERDGDNCRLARMNRTEVVRSSGSSPLFRYYDTHKELENCVAHTIASVMHAPGIIKCLGVSTAMEYHAISGAIAPDVPESILMENFSFEDIDYIFPKVISGALPKWFIRQWLEDSDLDMQVKGVTYEGQYAWTKIASLIVNRNIAPLIQREHLSDPGIDWFELFPNTKKLYEAQSNVRLRDVVPLAATASGDVQTYTVILLNAHIGEEHNFVCSVIVYWLGIVAHLRRDLIRHIVMSRMLEIPEHEWVKVHKEVHNLVRTTGTLFGKDLNLEESSKLQYTYALVGRRIYTIDPEPEIRKRQDDKISHKFAMTSGFNSAEYWRLFKEGVDRAYSRLATRGRARWRNYSDFFKVRYEWAAGGAVTTVPPEYAYLKQMNDVIVETKNGILALHADATKKRLVEKVGNPGELAMMLYDHWGYNTTRLAIKPNEPAKDRVLLPGSLLHYIVTTFILGNVERTGPVGCVRLGDSDDIHIGHYDLYLGTRGNVFMLDFADHNSQHSIPEMQYIMEALMLPMIKMGMDRDDTIWFANWVITSFSNMRAIDEKGNTHVLNSGLFSGWRSTTWINTVACHAYIYVGIETCKKFYGNSSAVFFEGAGDDVVVNFRLCSDAVKFYNMMHLIGFEMQSSKQLFLANGVEFLRMTAHGGKMLYCVNRMLPNFVCGDLERSSPDFRSRAGGAYATCAALVRRGLSQDVAHMLFEAFIKKWLRVRVGDGYVRVPNYVLYGDYTCGGLGIPDPRARTWILSKRIDISKDIAIVNIRADDEATSDMAEVKAKELHALGVEKVDIGIMKQQMLEDVYSSAIKPLLDESAIYSIQQLIEDPPEILGYRVVVGETCENTYLRLLQTMDSPDYGKFHQRFYKYESMRPATGYSSITHGELSQLLQLDINKAELCHQVRIPVYLAFSVPEYMLNAIIKVVQYWVYMNTIDIECVADVVSTLVYTYNQYMHVGI